MMCVSSSQQNYHVDVTQKTDDILRKLNFSFALGKFPSVCKSRGGLTWDISKRDLDSLQRPATIFSQIQDLIFIICGLILT